MKNLKKTNIQVSNKHKIVNEQEKAVFEYETETIKKRKISVRSPRWFDKLVRGIKRPSR